MSTQLVRIEPNRKYRKEVPEAHRKTLDTRLKWLWNQRFGTVQTVWQYNGRAGGDVLDHTAATLILQAIMGQDLDSIAQLLNRIEGGPITDAALAEREETTIRV